MTQERAPSWGITPVPERLQVLGAFDSLLLWGNLSVSLLVIVIGALLVPALSLRDALLAIVVGAVAGNALLGVAAAIGADARVPGMVRAARAARAAWLVAADGAQRRAERRLVDVRADHHRHGRRRRVPSTSSAGSGTWLWTLVFGTLSWGLGMLGPIGFVRRYLRKFASWALLFSMAYLTYWAISKSQLHAFWARARARAASRRFGQAVDLVIGSVVSWTPLAADYTRFARDRRSAGLGAGVGYFVPTIWCIGLGVLIVLARGVSDAQALPAAVAAAGGIAFVALVGDHDRREREGVRRHLLDRRLDPELPPARLAAPADHARLGRRDRARARAEPRQLPELPLPARLVLRPALRRARRRLARRAARHYSASTIFAGPGVEARPARRLDRRLRPLPVAVAGRPALVDEPRRADASR